MKSNNSMFQPPDFSSGAPLTDLRLKRQRAASPAPTCESMKSTNSMFQPPDLTGGAPPNDPRSERKRPVSPAPTFKSMKSSNSIFQAPDFSGGATPPDPSWGRDDVLQNQFRCGVCEKLMKDPVSINCRQCIVSHLNQSDPSEYFTCTKFGKRSKISPVLQSSKAMEEIVQQDSKQPPADVLNKVLERHKTSMRKKYESLFEGIKIQENKTLLNRIYTQLYITEGESEGVNEEHEVLQMEKTSRNQHLGDVPIECNDIFKPVYETGVERNKIDEVPKLRTVLTKGIAGIGKTVSVQKFILDWAEGAANQDVDFIFVLPFRELNLIKDDQYSLHKLLCDFHPELNHVDFPIYSFCKVLFIFDGLDESKISLNFNQHKKISDVTVTSTLGVLMLNLIKENLLSSAYIWITSRPAAANQIPAQYINRVTEIQGFTDSQKEEYFRKRISDQDQAQNIISHIKKARSLHIMCHMPVFCWMSATVFQNILASNFHAEIPTTLTEMYIHFLLIQTNIKNHKYGEREGKDLKTSLISSRAMILKLAELAFKQLMKGNVMFYEEDLKECSIEVNEASVYSGICTEIFKEKSVLCHKNVYCFVHLSFQEFLAALYVVHCFINKKMEELKLFLKGRNRMRSDQLSLDVFLKCAMDKALESQNGHLDLFLRFLHGISLESNQRLLQDFLTHTQCSSECVKEIILNLKKKQKKNVSPERWINLLHCMLEMKDNSVYEEMQAFIKSTKCPRKLTLLQCSTLAHILQVSEEALEEFDSRNYNISNEGLMRLLPAVRNCQKALLAYCKLTTHSWEILTSALQVTKSPLRVLDLSYNVMHDSEWKLLSDGLKSPHCKLEILRLVGCNVTTKSCEILMSVLQSDNCTLEELDLSNNDLLDLGVKLLSDGLRMSKCKLQILKLSGCMITEEGCSYLASALGSNPLHLKELDLTYNHPGVSGVKLLSAKHEDPHCKLDTLWVKNVGQTRMKPGVRKYACKLTLDPDTAHTKLSLSEGNRKVTCTKQQHSYPDSAVRFKKCQQVLCRESLTERCYWEAEWNRDAVIAVTCERSKGQDYDCKFGRNKNSWCLSYADNMYSFWYNDMQTDIPAPPTPSNKVGVYLDWQAGILSFYSVSPDTYTLTHLYTSRCTFTKPLYAGFTVWYTNCSVQVCQIE